MSGPVPVDFERFYRGELRFCVGGRMRTCEVARRYQAWAELDEAPSLGVKQIKRAMLNIGHSYFTSNGAFFGDVRSAKDAPDIPDNFPLSPFGEAPPADPRCRLVALIDQAEAELQRIRVEAAAL